MSTQEQPQQRKSLLSRFRRGRKAEKSEESVEDKRENTPSPVPIDETEEELSEREESIKLEAVVPVATKSDVESKSEVKSWSSWRSKGKHRKKSKKSKTRSPRGKAGMVKLEAPPPAREAAFSGPPRYDWIDIVSH